MSGEDCCYEFNHKCSEMPDETSLVKLKFSNSSQFSFEKHVRGAGLFTSTIYGFKFCPYCGEKVISE